MVYLKVNALRVNYRIYQHEFTNNEREISIPYEVDDCGIENFEFIVSERVQVNRDNSLADCVDIFISQTEYTAKKKKKNIVVRSLGVMTVVCWIYTTAIAPR